MDRTKAPFLVIIALAVIVSLPIYPTNWHLLWHIFGAVLFLGNLIVSAAWMAAARRTDDPGVVSFAARAVARADWLFTAPSVVLILLNGIALAGKLYGYDHIQDQSWLTVAIVLFVLSGVVWVGFLMRFQAAMIRLSSPATEITDDLRAVIQQWVMWGGIATILPIIALWLMVVKPALWS